MTPSMVPVRTLGTRTVGACTGSARMSAARIGVVRTGSPVRVCVVAIRSAPGHAAAVRTAGSGSFNCAYAHVAKKRADKMQYKFETKLEDGLDGDEEEETMVGTV